MIEFRMGDRVVHNSFDRDDVYSFTSGNATINHIPMIVIGVDEERAFCQYYCFFTHKFVELWFYKITLRKI